MKVGGGKQKGADFERGVCKRLSLWVSHGARADLYWRSAMSGGRATIQRKAGQRNLSQGGDISAVGELGHSLTDRYSIECKFVKDLELASFIIHHRGALMSYWRQTRRDAAAARKAPLLIAKQNNYPALVLAPSAHAEDLGLAAGEDGFPATLVSIEGNRVLISLLDRMLEQPYTLDQK